MLNKADLKLLKTSRRKSEKGFTLVEAVAAIFIVTIGLMGTAAAITYSLEFGAISRNVTSAKSVIISSIEEIETLRNARRLEFKQIANVGAVNNAGTTNAFSGFSTGFQAVSKEPGRDGVNGTADDFIARGADEIFGTADDFNNPELARAGYRRRIEITNLSDSIKEILITVQYVGRAGKVGEISGVCYLNDEARVTR
ncbi:MAG TPA: prepilin-type N-terminal cleavage/methylation domain-containing protein [Pyrinomonadaceae bacterium]|nr:prepilin-type N-terminal cleavage/methylation domain-containing protein [Pyrinomonadaceae bacterium]